MRFCPLPKTAFDTWDFDLHPRLLLTREILTSRLLLTCEFLNSAVLTRDTVRLLLAREKLLLTRENLTSTRDYFWHMKLWPPPVTAFNTWDFVLCLKLLLTPETLTSALLTREILTSRLRLLLTSESLTTPDTAFDTWDFVLCLKLLLTCEILTSTRDYFWHVRLWLPPETGFEFYQCWKKKF